MAANGAITEAPLILTYSSVVSRNTIRLELLVYGLNDLYIMACDIVNSYLNAPCRYNIWLAEGP